MRKSLNTVINLKENFVQICSNRDNYSHENKFRRCKSRKALPQCAEKSY